MPLLRRIAAKQRQRECSHMLVAQQSAHPVISTASRSEITPKPGENLLKKCKVQLAPAKRLILDRIAQMAPHLPYA